MTTFPVHSGETAPEASLPRLLAVPPQRTFDGTWPFEARYTEAPGFRMHYVDEGNGVIFF